MRSMRLFNVLVLVVACAAGLAACGSSGSGGGTASCTSLCQSAQAGNCTTVHGDCGQFCAALDVVDGEAGCGAQHDAYETCLGSPASVCQQDCSSQQSSLESCVAAYCAGHLSEASCQTLTSSF